MSEATARVLVPQRARRGEVVEVRVLISHPMESGFRADAEGRLLARDIIRHFACSSGGELIFAADLFPSIAANPYLAFALRVDATLTLQFDWTGDNGFAHRESATILVT